MPINYSRMLSRAKEGRGDWESTWQDIALVCNTENAAFNTSGSAGQQRQQRIFDSTATLALNRGMSALSGLITPMGQRWHTLSTDNPELNRDRALQEFFEEVTRILFAQRYAARTGFNACNNQSFKNVLSFGTAPSFIEEAPSGRGLEYQSLFLGKTYLMANGKGRINGFVREIEEKKEDIIDQFGADTPRIIDEAPEGSKHTYYHFCCPNPDYVEGSNRAEERQYHYAYAVAGNLDEPFSTGGYYEFPMPVCRDVTAPNEIYSRSAAMHVLPEIRNLNRTRASVIKGVHRQVEPPLLAASRSNFATGGLGNRVRINVAPNGVTFGAIDANGRPTLQPMNMGGNLNSGSELIQDSRQAINQSFLIDLFQILVESPHERTATEIIQMTQERGILLAPVGAQVEADYLSVMIEREIGILARQGLLPDFPDILSEANGEYRITYTSPLARAQRSEELQGINAVTQYAEAAAAYQPEIMDYINFEDNLKRIQDIQGAPISSIRPDDEVRRMRQNRQQAQQQQQSLEQAPELARTARDLAQAGMLNQ